jgi:hypothetical protein
VGQPKRSATWLRRLLILSGALLLCADPASSQFREEAPYSRVNITPVVGYRLPYSARVEATVFTDTHAISSRFDEERGGGYLTGGEAEIRIAGPVSIFGTVIYAEPAENRVVESGMAPQDFSGPTVWLASAGLVIRLPEPVPDYRRFPFVTSLQIAPGLVREIPRRTRLAPDHPLYVPSPWETIDHMALNAGFRVITLLGTPRLALQFGVNDFVTFWNANAVSQQLERAYHEQLGLDVTAEYTLPISHQLHGHLGISFRF